MKHLAGIISEGKTPRVYIDTKEVASYAKRQK